MHRSLSFVLLAVSAVPPAPAAVEGRNTVFAHYMTCFTRTVPEVKREILLAQHYGVEGWALNCGIWKRRDPKTGEWKPFDG